MKQVLNLSCSLLLRCRGGVELVRGAAAADTDGLAPEELVQRVLAFREGSLALGECVELRLLFVQVGE